MREEEELSASSWLGNRAPEQPTDHPGEQKHEELPRWKMQRASLVSSLVSVPGKQIRAGGKAPSHPWDLPTAPCPW